MERYAEGMDATGLLKTVMRGAASGWRRTPVWAWRLLSHPVQALQANNPIGFARQTMRFAANRGLECRRAGSCSAQGWSTAAVEAQGCLLTGRGGPAQRQVKLDAASRLPLPL